MILTHLIFFQFFPGAGHGIVVPTKSSVLPDSTGKISHLRIFRRDVTEGEARLFHNLIKAR